MVIEDFLTKLKADLWPESLVGQEKGSKIGWLVRYWPVRRRDSFSIKKSFARKIRVTYWEKTKTLSLIRDGSKVTPQVGL